MSVAVSLTCDPLAESLEHALLGMLSDSANRKGIAAIGLDRAVEFLGQDRNTVRWALVGLEDQGYIRMEGGETTILIECWHGFDGCPINPLFAAAGREEVRSAIEERRASPTSPVLASGCRGVQGGRQDKNRSNVRAISCPACGAKSGQNCVTSRGQARTSNHAERVQAFDRSQRSTRLTTAYLAGFYFPRVCRQNGIGPTDGPLALVREIGKSDVPLERIQWMMDEFGKHPEWSVRGTPWKVFLRKFNWLYQKTEKREIVQKVREQQEAPASIKVHYPTSLGKPPIQ